MPLNTSAWWRLICDFENWFLHKSVQLDVSITDQIWLLSRALLCFCSDSLRIKKGDLAVLIIIIAFCCFLLSSFCSRSFFPWETSLFFTSFPPKIMTPVIGRFHMIHWNQQWPWHLVLLMVVALTRVFWTTLKTFCILYQRHQDFLLEDCSFLNTGTVPIEKCSFCYLLTHLRLSRVLRNAGLQFERLGV